MSEEGATEEMIEETTRSAVPTFEIVRTSALESPTAKSSYTKNPTDKATFGSGGVARATLVPETETVRLLSSGSLLAIVSVEATDPSEDGE